MTTFVLVHGAMHGSWCWDRVAKPLRDKGHHVETVDMPGRPGGPQIPGPDLASYAATVTAAVDRCDEPVVLVAHSLGGIACVEMLIEQELPEVKLFVTAGSQSPYFYEIGALRTLPFKANVTCKLPAHFPKWVNFYDRRDFLSFVGRGVFGAKVTDKEVNNGQPFPQSHSAYWSNDAVWKTIKECL